MTHWKAVHCPHHTALAWEDYFVSWEVARALCGLISPDGYTTTKQFSVVNTFKGIANNISFDVYNALDYDEWVEISCEKGTVMRLVKNIGVGQNKPVHYAVFLDQMMQSPTNLMLLLTTWMIGEVGL